MINKYWMYDAIQHRALKDAICYSLPYKAQLVLLCVQDREGVPIHPGLRVSLRRSTGTIARLSPSNASEFSYVPLDCEFGANRTLPGFSALGDVALRLRPARMQRITLPPLPYMESFPIYTSFSSATGNPGWCGALGLPIFMIVQHVVCPLSVGIPVTEFDHESDAPFMVDVQMGSWAI